MFKKSQKVLEIMVHDWAGHELDLAKLLDETKPIKKTISGAAYRPAIVLTKHGPYKTFPNRVGHPVFFHTVNATFSISVEFCFAFE